MPEDPSPINMGERNAVLLDAGARGVIAFLDRLIELLPVAQLDVGHGRLDQIVALLAHDAALGFRTHRARTHQDGDDGGIAAHALADQPPPGPLAIAAVLGLKINLAGDVAGDDRPRPARLFAHHIHRQIVHHPAIHQKMAVMGDRRQDARQRHAGAQGPPQCAVAMDDGCAPW